ncbi:ATP-dependent DNA helicase [filamentous cyanobacterium LEGE 11480]|uniref:ATP-dependent DNA helicase n=1 Tax=Romeriopsis navalis LEGE 11480 TaxID=2777977 RepID=A0A928VJH5_9CYAN|nr:ATP-dependent DNA helicase [Romeriopsis navalis]MBE9028782.1 ATP-dependent DNA helicase [Romeriopsis navalis LEGE 11480]
MIEAEVHQQLRNFLRQQGEPYWVHHLTMARLVARALRVGRSALMQTGTHQGHYRLSYLVPLLMWSGPVILVAPQELHQRLMRVEIPRLRQCIAVTKPIEIAAHWPNENFQGLLITTPEVWLRDRLDQTGKFPTEIPVIVDGIDDLETWTREQLTCRIQPPDWESLMLACPDQLDLIRDLRVSLTREIYQHPENPYNCYLLEAPERQQLIHLTQRLQSITPLPTAWAHFIDRLERQESLTWITVNRPQGVFTLHTAPIDLAPALARTWSQQPTVLIGEAIDLDTDANIYRERIGLGDVTCLKFAPDRHDAMIQLYQPEGIPLPNTPQYQEKMLQELRSLLSVNPSGFSVVLTNDTPLKSQLGAILAAEYGSRVQVEQTCLDENGILVCDWEFWQRQQRVLPTPQLLAVTTLPIPSLEHPIVAGHVSYYKKLRQDWFRLYLLPAALATLQRSIAPVRDAQGVVAMLDSRVIFRSYGEQVLTALSPFARLSYFDGDLFLDRYNLR